MFRKRLVGAFFIIGLALARDSGLQQPPATPKRPVTDVYHGVRVTDDYRWLENASDPQVLEWVRQAKRLHALDSGPHPRAR
jgi:prolyl oligopeptidase